MEEASIALFQWFDDNPLKGNPDKCHVLLSSNEKITIKIGDYEIENSEQKKLLGVTLDWKLYFDCHISDICKKGSGKLNALARIVPFIGLSKRHLLINTFLN